MAQATSPQPGRRVLFYHDSSGYYAYIHVRSSSNDTPVSQQEIDIIKTRLKESGVEPALSGRSYRRASNGKQYEWYIRITDKGAKPSRDKVASAIREISPPHDEKQSEEAQAYIKQLIDSIENEKRNSHDFQSRLRDANIAVRSLEEKIAQLQQDKERLEGTVRGRIDEYSSNENRLSAERDALEGKIQQFRSENQSLRNDKDKIQADKDYYESEFNKVTAEYKRLQRHLDEESIPAVAEGTEHDFEKLIGCLLPEVVFLKGSLSRLRNEMRYELALRKIKAIVLDNLTPDGTVKRQGYPSWKEYHFSTGQGNQQGRIYTRVKDGKYRVLVSRKQAQDKHIDELWDVAL